MIDPRRLDELRRAGLRRSFAKWFAPVPPAPPASLTTVKPNHKARRTIARL